MAKLTYIEPNGKETHIETTADQKSSLLDIALDNHIELDHACGGNAACSTCHIKIMDGMDQLNEIDDIEEDLIDFAEDADLKSRLACQCYPQSNEAHITIQIPSQKGLH
ncbi:MAG: (2Fe-2S)-binding protein [Calditrichaeota bacterium]|nr:(2Fe-2S)-binding protein [Calditrichota bacterium]